MIKPNKNRTSPVYKTRDVFIFITLNRDIYAVMNGCTKQRKIYAAKTSHHKTELKITFVLDFPAGVGRLILCPFTMDIIPTTSPAMAKPMRNSTINASTAIPAPLNSGIAVISPLVAALKYSGSVYCNIQLISIAVVFTTI